jgi:hypothetical protein
LDETEAIGKILAWRASGEIGVQVPGDAGEVRGVVRLGLCGLPGDEEEYDWRSGDAGLATA